ncbi:MAG: phosphatase PAP2 family protein [Desulfobacteraceae bacterium]|jgi:membrane-associated PAP2 superfamily phosphatase
MPSISHQSISDHFSRKLGWRLLAAQFAGLVIITVIFTIFDWDRRVAELFYRIGRGWYLDKQALWVWLHAYGTVPGLVLTLAALISWLASFYLRLLEPWRRPCLVVVLTTLLAAGLLVNAVLKQYWGRPRPSQTIEFGGKWEYRPIFPPGTPGKGASFPCGHCTMGFVFLAMASFRRQSKTLAYGGVAIGIVMGGLLSAARVVQGAHFLSDTIWSLGIVGMVATALGIYLPRPDQKIKDRRATFDSPRRRAWVTLVSVVAIMLISIGFMTRRPFYKTMVYALDLSPPLETIHIKINGAPESMVVQYANRNNGRLKVDAHGFGWMEFDYQMGFGIRAQEQTLNITLHIVARSYFAELDHAITLVLPERIKDQVTVRLNNQPT